MSNKTKLQNNNINLQDILDSIQNLPSGGGTGENVTAELTEQDEIIEQLFSAIQNKSAGSSTEEAFAVIGVTYPSGSTLTCVKGTTTLTAENTNGKWAFNLPEAGTWTIKATSGSDSASKNVSITAKGQFEMVELSFRYYLFNNGSKVTWQGDAPSGSSTSIGTTLKCTRAATVGHYAGLFTTQDINITNYSKIGINVKSKTGSRLSFGLASNDLSVAVCSRSIETTGEIILDISNISGSYKPSISADFLAYEAISGSVEITQVWLE